MKRFTFLFIIALLFISVSCIEAPPDTSLSEKPLQESIQEPIKEVEQINFDIKETITGFDEIRHHLGVDYSVQEIEYNLSILNDIVKWQFLDLAETLNLTNFPAFIGTDSSLMYVLYNTDFNTKQGDAIIVEYPTSQLSLVIDLGDGKFYREQLNNDIKLTSVETIDMTNLSYDDRLSVYDMKYQYSSDLFDFYTYDYYVQRLPEMGFKFDEITRLIIVALNIELPDRIAIWYFNPHDFKHMDSKLRNNDDFDGYGAKRGGNFGELVIQLTRPEDSDDVCVRVIGWFVHYLIHTLQADLPIGEFGLPFWITEGAATYFEPDLGCHLDRADMYRLVRENKIPSFSNISESTQYTMDKLGVCYRWYATVIEFVAEEYGTEYITELHRYGSNYELIFGISEEEFGNLWHQYLQKTFG